MLLFTLNSADAAESTKAELMEKTLLRASEVSKFGTFLTIFIYTFYWWHKYFRNRELDLALNPLTPMIDQDDISPDQINTISNRDVMRIKKNTS